MRAIIVGGGIGGLSTAIALRRAGLDALVFERAPELREIGAGISLWTNGVRALGQLGLGEIIAEKGSPVEQIESRAWNGRLLDVLPMGEVGRRLGAMGVCIHRGELLATLADALDPDVVRVNAPCVGYEQDAAGVTVRFADGREERGDIVVGADGINSTIRAQHFAGEAPRYAGYTCWRGIADFDIERISKSTFVQAYGRGSVFGFFQLSPGKVFWFGTKDTPEGTPDASGGRRQEVYERFRDWLEPIGAIVAATEEAAILRHDIYDRPPIEQWSHGRATLLGDAAHAMVPSLGQGAAQAIEDAVVLAKCLHSETDAVAALRQYERRRVGRTNRMMLQARRYGTMSRWKHPVACAVRDTFMRLVPKSLTLRQMEQLLGYEP